MGARTSTCFFALVIFYLIEVISRSMNYLDPQALVTVFGMVGFGWCHRRLVNLPLFFCQRFKLRGGSKHVAAPLLCPRVVWQMAAMTYSFSGSRPQLESRAGVSLYIYLICVGSRPNAFSDRRISPCFVSRSTDYGSTYERMNDKVGSKTVLSYLYVCPTNKRKVRNSSGFVFFLFLLFVNSKTKLTGWDSDKYPLVSWKIC